MAMMRMKNDLLFALIAIVICGCAKHHAEKSAALTATQLLTAKPWRLLSHGFDSNKNGLVDSNEVAIKDCERDNTYIFNKDGSGIVNENSNVCNGNDPSHTFIWALRHNDTVLDFYFGKNYITKLTTDSLYITDSNSDQVKLLLIYAH